MNELFSADTWLCRMINMAGDAMWTYFLIPALILCAVWFTLRCRGVQFRMFTEMVRLLGDSATSGKSGKSASSGKPGDSATDGKPGSPATEAEPQKKHISSFQAFAVSIASRVGVGNLAGVATAIAIGGPGAIFWMWLMALLGAASAFVESTLAQLFKKKGSDSFIGGPAYYILQGLKKPWLASIFAVLITITFGFSNNSIQSNTISTAFNVAFGLDPRIVGVGVAVISTLVIFGGIQRIAGVSGILVPVMAISYLVLALFVTLTHISMIPEAFSMIVKDAFGVTQIAGGGIGATMLIGIKRGLFSNEAGEGSTPNVAATASTSHPVKQGLIQALGVFTDTILICSCTAFIILLSGIGPESGLNGIALTQAAIVSEIGEWGKYFIAIAVFLFAYSTIIGNYYYGEVNIRFLTSNKTVLFVYRLCSGVIVILFGAFASLDLVWSITDFFMVLLTGVNLVSIVLLGKYVFALLGDYRAQKRAGIKEPEFHRSSLEATSDLDIECWD